MTQALTQLTVRLARWCAQAHLVASCRVVHKCRRCWCELACHWLCLVFCLLGRRPPARLQALDLVNRAIYDAMCGEVFGTSPAIEAHWQRRALRLAAPAVTRSPRTQEPTQRAAGGARPAVLGQHERAEDTRHGGRNPPHGAVIASMPPSSAQHSRSFAGAVRVTAARAPGTDIHNMDTGRPHCRGRQLGPCSQALCQRARAR